MLWQRMQPVQLSRIRLSSNRVITRPHLISPKPSSITPARHQILITTRYLSAHLTSVNCPISFRYCWTQASYSSFICVIKDHHLSSPFVSESPSVTEDRTNTDRGTDPLPKMRLEIASINVWPREEDNLSGGCTIFLFQNGRCVEDYVEEFIANSHQAFCGELTLMEGFRVRLDEEIQMLMPSGDPSWCLAQYVNFALCIAGIPSSSPLPPLVPSSSPLPPLVPSSSPLPPLVPSSSPLPPLVPSSSPLPPLVPSSSPLPPLDPSSSSLPPLVPSSSPLPLLVPSSSPSSPLVPSSSALPECPPVPAPRQRPPVPAPRQRPPVPAPRQPRSRFLYLSHDKLYRV